jgi:sodium/bile acid cotransporter 7
MLTILKKNWFILGLISAAIITVADGSGITTRPGLWLKTHNGPDIVIVVIFLLSGLSLSPRQIRNGLTDIKGTLTALCIIFIVAPVLAICFTILPLETGTLLGLLLVSAMPTTLSSGVVMTGASGGNMAHALLITILASSLAVVSIPVVFGWQLALIGDSRVIEIARIPIMIKISSLVLLPLVAGISLRHLFEQKLKPFLPLTTVCNQTGILLMVWMALCAGRASIVEELGAIFIIAALVFSFHLLLIIAGLLLTNLAGIARGRRESVIFMGGQKTLPLSVILQVSLFPEYGTALVVCVAHHIVHLIMDAYLINYLKKRPV